jgi:hypothetical protein
LLAALHDTVKRAPGSLRISACRLLARTGWSTRFVTLGRLPRSCPCSVSPMPASRSQRLGISGIASCSALPLPPAIAAGLFLGKQSAS